MLPDAEKMKKLISITLKKEGLSREEKIEKACQHIIEHLKGFGSFAVHKTGIQQGEGNFFYHLKTGEVLSISKKSELLSTFLYHNFGVSCVSKIFPHLLEVLKHDCFMGDEICVTVFSHFDSEKGILFFPRTQSEMVVCKKEGIEVVANGTNGVYLGNSGQFSSFQYLGQDFVGERSAIERLLFADLNCPENNAQFLNAREAAFILEIFFYLIPFAGAMETRPILVVHGQKGSGKSSLLKRMGKAFFGPDWNISLIPRSRRDLETEFANIAFSCFDNVDRQLQKSQRDALAAITTGGGYRSRKLFTDSDQKSYSPRPLVSITSRDPAFTVEDDDIVDRAIIVKLETLAMVIPENELVSEVIKHRNEILTEMINAMPGIIAALQEDAPNGMNRSFRMADFANFAFKASYPIFRRRMTDKEITEMLDNVFKKLVASQRAYVLSNPLHYTVDAYVQECINKNLTPLQIESHPLYVELLRIDKDFNLGFQKICKSLIAFGKLMTNNEKIFADRYGYSRKRGTGNKMEHTFEGMKKEELEI
jgi:hypothetical protein